MKVAIVHNKEAKTIEVTERLNALLEQAGIQRDDHEPELVISVGGDGTLLSAFHHYSHCLNDVRFLGVHTGHLGFYTDWRDYERTGNKVLVIPCWMFGSVIWMKHRTSIF